MLQIDSVNVFARSHYLPLFSRLGLYDPALLDRVFLSRTTHYVEYLAHEATFVPIEDWSLWRFRMDAFRRRWESDPESWLSQNARTVAWVKDELRARGPLRPAQLRADAPRERGTWWDWDYVKLALEYLWRIGDVAISGRRGFERHYALEEQVIPTEVRERVVTRDEAIRELVHRAARSSGVATESDLADYYRIRDRKAVRGAIDDLVDSGDLQPVQVRGWERGGRPVPTWLHRDAVLPAESTPGRSSPLSTPWSGSESARCARSPSTTGSRSMCQRTSGATAITRCRYWSETASSRGSI